MMAANIAMTPAAIDQLKGLLSLYPAPTEARPTDAAPAVTDDQIIGKLHSLEELSERELKVLNHRAFSTTKRVANDLGIERKTVDSHMSNIQSKLCVKHMGPIGAVIMGIATGLIDLRKALIEILKIKPQAAT